MRSAGLVPGRMTLRRRQDAALAPVRAVLLRDAAAEADRVLADARNAARAKVEQARADAAGAINRAEAEGRAQVAALALAELSRGRREARRILLDAESRARAQLAGQIRSALINLRYQPGYGELRAKLVELARRAAGPGATVTEHHYGGVVASAPGVFVDCSLPRLAERVIEILGPQLNELSAP
ncbi:MAG: hypothetical protein ACLQFR_12975 [Streptosporangiaceae bacterium]